MTGHDPLCQRRDKVWTTDREYSIDCDCDLIARVRGEQEWEYTIVWDGEPRMDGSHYRQQMGTFSSLQETQGAYRLVVARSVRAPKPNLRIERRRVGPWEFVSGESDG